MGREAAAAVATHKVHPKKFLVLLLRDEQGRPAMAEIVAEVNVAEVIRMGSLDMQVCVPDYWTDAQVKEFADRKNPCGTDNGWFIRKQGDRALAGADERVRCGSRSGFVHVMLDA